MSYGPHVTPCGPSTHAARGASVMPTALQTQLIKCCAAAQMSTAARQGPHRLLGGDDEPYRTGFSYAPIDGHPAGALPPSDRKLSNGGLTLALLGMQWPWRYMCPRTTRRQNRHPELGERTEVIGCAVKEARRADMVPAGWRTDNERMTGRCRTAIGFNGYLAG